MMKKTVLAVTIAVLAAPASAGFSNTVEDMNDAGMIDNSTPVPMTASDWRDLHNQWRDFRKTLGGSSEHWEDVGKVDPSIPATHGARRRFDWSRTPESDSFPPPMVNGQWSAGRFGNVHDWTAPHPLFPDPGTACQAKIKDMYGSVCNWTLWSRQNDVGYTKDVALVEQMVQEDPWHEDVWQCRGSGTEITIGDETVCTDHVKTPLYITFGAEPVKCDVKVYESDTATISVTQPVASPFFTDHAAAAVCDAGTFAEHSMPTGSKPLANDPVSATPDGHADFANMIYNQYDRATGEYHSQMFLHHDDVAYEYMDANGAWHKTGNKVDCEIWAGLGEDRKMLWKGRICFEPEKPAAISYLYQE